LDAPSAPEIPENARMDIDTEGSGSGGGKEDKEIYESSLDKTFQKFADRVGENAEQILRYEYKGKPLLYSDTDAVGKALAPHAENGPSSNAKVTTSSSKGGSGMPRCTNCGAERVFEVQLTPHAITELEAEEMSLDGMEWGTIIMGVCSKDCKPSDVTEGQVGYVEEWVGVQWEEVESKK
jgi:pre-rRNA-processing protein TSR4